MSHGMKETSENEGEIFGMFDIRWSGWGAQPLMPQVATTHFLSRKGALSSLRQKWRCGCFESMYILDAEFEQSIILHRCNIRMSRSFEVITQTCDVPGREKRESVASPEYGERLNLLSSWGSEVEDYVLRALGKIGVDPRRIPKESPVSANQCGAAVLGREGVIAGGCWERGSRLGESDGLRILNAVV